MKKIYLGTNLKMFKGYQETIDYIEMVDLMAKSISTNVQLFVIPSFLTIKEAIDKCKSNRLWIGSQNMHHMDFGAFTGEVSPKQLKEIGVVINELGHSERRQLFGEDDSFISEKVKASINLKMKPLLCVGENLLEKNSGASNSTVTRQLKIGISKITDSEVNNLLVAYEPVWAIGENGIPAAPDYIANIHFYLRQILVDRFGDKGREVPILYGGSVNLNNYKDIISIKNVDGLFIGRTAWNIDKFQEIICYVNQHQQQFL